MCDSPCLRFQRSTSSTSLKLTTSIRSSLVPDPSGEKLSASRRRTEHFQAAQAGSGSGFDPELIENFENVFFYRGFAIAEDACNLAVGFALGKPEQGFGDTRG